MKRVAITYSNAKKAVSYAEAVRNAGGEAVLVSASDGVKSLDGFAGLVLSGGRDINPGLYGQPPDPRTEEPDEARDNLEMTLLRDALDRDLPLLAICRGMQMFNVAHAGGTLYQHVEGHEVRLADASEPAHTALITPATALAGIVGEPELPVNSRHHQAVSNIGERLVISAQAPDGIVEALERPDRRFAVAVQWHPEDQWRFPAQQRLFQAFTRAC